MLVPLSWLKEYVDLNVSTADLVERLTLAGLEIASIERVGDWWDAETLLVGQVMAVLPHPDADRLVLVDVNYGGAEPQRVVTGAPNLYAFKGAATLPTLKVAFAREGAVLLDAYSDQQPRPKKKLKASKIRGIPSAGMVCSERELGLSEEHEGIILLPEDAPVGQSLREYLGDEVLTVELTPDMARCLSMIGIAREVSALSVAPLHLPADQWTPEGSDQASDYADVRIEDPQLCNRYTAIVITDVKVAPSPKWMQERLTKAGMRPINNIVDITNYVMLEWGQPLHAFDYGILKRRAGDAKPTIIVRRAQAGEKFTTLDNVQRELDDNMLMIADTAGSIALAGVMGGLESEVSDQTQTVLLESATFEGINNRRTSQKLKLNSEASFRFARGVPAELNPVAARRAAELMRLYANGRIVPGLLDAYPVPQPTRVVYTTVSDQRRLLGVPVALDEIASALRKLDFQVKQVDEIAADAAGAASFALHRLPNEPLLACIAPWHRLDVAIPADLTEEVARIIGYEQVGTNLIDDVMPTQRRNDTFETEEHVRDILINLGLQETINHPLTTPENHTKLQIAPTAPYVALANPGTPERRALRRSLLVSAMENLARNLRYTSRLTTFEVGRVYLPEAGDGLLPKEERRVSIVLTGARGLATGLYPDPGGNEAMDFFDLKGMVEILLNRLGFTSTQIEYRAKPDTGTFGPRCAEVVLEGKSLGLIGEIHPQARAAYNLPSVRINAAELNLEPLIKPHWRLQPMQPISSYPPVVEDLAFEVAEDVTSQQAYQVIRQTGGALVTNIELFDIYRGEPLPVGFKSLAYRVTYQSPERSLHEKEVEQLRKRIIAAVEKATGGKLRG
ncbi:MAG: phenylalanine--tRNA ligase subunit beta [Chloroflexi bacterium]|nr:phenylalanine--tRNA ligase subunit beta [Chloroflexota bacterium]